MPAQLPCSQASSLSKGPKPTRPQPSKRPDNPGCERETGRGLLPAPAHASTRGASPARLYRPRYKLTPKVKQPGRVCGNINGGMISVRWVSCARCRHHPCQPTGEGGNARLQQKAPRAVPGESRRGWQEAPCPLSATAQLRAWVSPNTGGSGGTTGAGAPRDMGLSFAHSLLGQSSPPRALPKALGKDAGSGDRGQELGLGSRGSMLPTQLLERSQQSILPISAI